MQDRRHFVRWQINRPTQCKLEGAVRSVTCIIHDISFKGARISLLQKLPRDAPLKISIILSEEFTSLDIEAWIIWHKKVIDINIYGICFVRIKDIDKEKIYKFMRSYFPEQINRQWWQGPMVEGGERGMPEEKTESSKDRRLFQRFDTRFPLKFIDLKRNKEGQAQVHNISAKGLGILTEDELLPDTLLEMWLNIPDRGEPVYGRGRVIWSRLIEGGQWQAGVDLEKADLMAISRVLRTS